MGEVRPSIEGSPLEVVSLSVLDITPMGEVRWSGVTRHPNERYVISCNGSEVRHRDGVRRGRPNHSYHWDRASVAGDTVGEVVSLSVLDTGRLVTANGPAGSRASRHPRSPAWHATLRRSLPVLNTSTMGEVRGDARGRCYLSWRSPPWE